MNEKERENYRKKIEERKGSEKRGREDERGGEMPTGRVREGEEE